MAGLPWAQKSENQSVLADPGFGVGDCIAVVDGYLGEDERR